MLHLSLIKLLQNQQGYDFYAPQSIFVLINTYDTPHSETIICIMHRVVLRNRSDGTDSQ